MKKNSFLKEGRALFYAPTGKITKDLPVFYNPAMKLNRDIAVLLLKSIPQNHLKIADIMAATGVRGIRFLKELPAKKVESVLFNDTNEKANNLIKKNLKLNKIKNKSNITNKDASKILLESNGFNYIDIDPFGSPNPALDSAVRRIARQGIIAATATDTAALSGTTPKACIRKYWAQPLRNELMHEIGIRILVRKIQLIGMQYEKALTPVFCHSTQHYMRVYLQAEKTRERIPELWNQIGYFHYCNSCLERKASLLNREKCSCGNIMITAGPMWLGKLWDENLAGRMLKGADNKNKELRTLLMTINEEAQIQATGFYDLNTFCSKLKKSAVPLNAVLRKIWQRHPAARTHFSPTGIRTTMQVKEFVRIVKEF